jgi:hypothetical protein
MDDTLQEGDDSSSTELAEQLGVLTRNHSRLVRQYLLGKRKGQGKHKSMLDKLVDRDTLQEIETSANNLESTLNKYNMACQLRFEVYHQAIRELTTS